MAALGMGSERIGLGGREVHDNKAKSSDTVIFNKLTLNSDDNVVGWYGHSAIPVL